MLGTGKAGNGDRELKGEGGRDILSHKGSGLGPFLVPLFGGPSYSRSSGPRSYSPVAGEGGQELIHVKAHFAEELGQVAFALLGRE